MLRKGLDRVTQPTNTNTYGISVGTATSVCPIFEPFDPTIYSIGNGTYKTQQRWVNTVTNAIWVLESFSSSNGVVTANWKALAPIVVETVAPTSANYQYPLGQPWLNTTANAYYILVALSGTTATWDELTSSTSSGILTINTVGPTVAGNFTIGSSASTLTITNATNGINIDVTQPLSPAYGGTGVNNGTDTITLGGNVPPEGHLQCPAPTHSPGL